MKIKSGIVLPLLLIIILTLVFNTELVSPIKVNAYTPTVFQGPWWFDYFTNSVCWNSSDDSQAPNFLVDFDGDRSTVASAYYSGSGGQYGTFAELNIIKMIPSGAIYHNTAFYIGTLKIGGPTAHINKVQSPSGDYYYTEGFYYWVPDTTAPTDWVVCLKRSDGVNIIPVTDVFWFSEDFGRTWYSFDPQNPDHISPTANAGSDRIVYENELVTFDGSASSDNVGIVSYVWSFYDGDGYPQTLMGAVQTFTFTSPGTYPVTLTVVDAAEHYASDTVIITVPTPEGRIQELIETIDTLNIQTGIKNTLTSMLKNTINSLSSGKEKTAIKQLEAFINYVKFLPNKKLTLEQKESLISVAQEIIDQIK